MSTLLTQESYTLGSNLPRNTPRNVTSSVLMNPLFSVSGDPPQALCYLLCRKISPGIFRQRDENKEQIIWQDLEHISMSSLLPVICPCSYITRNGSPNDSGAAVSPCSAPDPPENLAGDEGKERASTD